MPRPNRGEVWLVDLGLAGKTRPCLLLTDYPRDNELAMVTVLAHTTALRGNPWEHVCPKPFLREGAFHLQQIQTVSTVKLERRLGALTVDEMSQVRSALANRLRI